MLEFFAQGDAAYQGGRVELFFNLCSEEVVEPTRIKYLQNPAEVKLGNFLHLLRFK